MLFAAVKKGKTYVSKTEKQTCFHQTTLNGYVSPAANGSLVGCTCQTFCLVMLIGLSVLCYVVVVYIIPGAGMLQSFCGSVSQKIQNPT